MNKQLCMFITYRTFSFDFRLETAIPLLLREIAILSKGNDISIAFPDEGAFKRFHTMFTSFKFPTITCTKIRDGNRRIVRVKDGKCYDVSFSFCYLPNSLNKRGTYDLHICSPLTLALSCGTHLTSGLPQTSFRCMSHCCFAGLFFFFPQDTFLSFSIQNVIFSSYSKPKQLCYPFILIAS